MVQNWSDKKEDTLLSRRSFLEVEVDAVLLHLGSFITDQNVHAEKKEDIKLKTTVSPD